MLLALASAQRCQTLFLLTVDDIEFVGDQTNIQVLELVKHSRPGLHLPKLVLPKLAEDKNNCLVD